MFVIGIEVADEGIVVIVPCDDIMVGIGPMNELWHSHSALECDIGR